METLGKHFKALASAALSKRGFQQGDLIAHWDVIAGDALAAISAPSSIKWPRATMEDTGRAASLVVVCNPGCALDVQYQSMALIERVNQFFGYRAITTVKVIQASQVVTRAARKRQFAATASANVKAKTATIDDQNLRQALERLGAHVESPGMA
jgi:hypothetical protein